MRFWKFCAVAVVLCLVGVACDYDPTVIGGNPQLTMCDGQAATLGFGFVASLDPAGGSTHVGTDGDDVIVVANGPVMVDAGAGDDTICIRSAANHDPGAAVTVIGGEGDDTIIATDGAALSTTCDAESISGCNLSDRGQQEPTLERCTWWPFGEFFADSDLVLLGVGEQNDVGLIHMFFEDEYLGSAPSVIYPGSFLNIMGRKNVGFAAVDSVSMGGARLACPLRSFDGNSPEVERLEVVAQGLAD